MNYKTAGNTLRLNTIYEVSKILASGTNLKVTLPSVINVLDNFLDMSNGIIFLYDFETKQLNPFVSRGVDFCCDKPLMNIEEYSRSVYNSGAPIVLQDISNKPALLSELNCKKNPGKRTSYVCLPIKAYRKVYGTLNLVIANTDYPFLFLDAVKLLEMVSSLIAHSVELSFKVKEEKAQFKEEKTRLQNELKSKYKIQNMIGRSRMMQNVFKNVSIVAKSSSTVLIRGESGTGKELIARAIHFNSERSKNPYITLNCTSLPESLLETELFGHEKGSYKKTSTARKGRFELADTGTIFLDEIGDIPISTQVKLLRVLQEKKFERLGGSTTIPVDIRIIAATNRNLEELVSKGKFREDLCYRLNLVPVFLPSLRDRREDIPLLVDHFINKFNRENDKSVEISDAVYKHLLNYDWPGNVRELENAIQRLVILSDDDIADTGLLPAEIRSYQSSTLNNSENHNLEETGHFTLTGSVENLEKEKIVEALKKCGCVKSRSAKMLGITARQLDYRIKKYSINVQKYG